MNNSRMAANAMRGVFGVLVILAVWCWATIAQAGPVGYWPLDGDGTAVVGTDGLMVGGPTASADRNGTAGGALAFDGALQQYVSVAGGGGLDAVTTATVSMWVQWNGNQDNGFGNRHGAVLGRQSNTVFSDNVLCIYNTADPNVSNINWETQLGQGMNSGVQPGSGTWRHVAVTVGPGGEFFYVDGVPVEVRTASAGFHTNPAVPLTIGAWIGDGDSYSTSSIDDVAIWNRALSPNQIADLASQVATPLTTADPIHVADVTASSELLGGFTRYAANTIDGLGHATIVPDGSPGSVPGMWLSNGTYAAPNDTNPEITFDLGTAFSLDSLTLYNYNEFLPGRPDLLQRGVQDMDILVSADNVTYTPLGTFTFGQATGDSANPGQVRSLGGAEARFVKFDILSNHGDANQFAGLNEVEFFGTRVGPGQIVPVSARASSELTSGNFRRLASNTVDGVGLGTVNPDGLPSDVSGMWLSNGTFTTPNDTDPEINFDLGGVHQLDSLALYNYNETLPGRPELLQRGVQDVEIFVSTDNATFTSVGMFSFDQAPGNATNPPQYASLGGVAARYVRLDIISNHGGDNNFAGLNEVEFFGTAMERMPISGVSVTASSALYEGGFDRRAVHLVDGTGLFADGHDDSLDPVHRESVHWLSTGIGFGQPGDDGDPELVFDLGDTYPILESARIWNYNEVNLTTRGVDEMEVLVSEDGTDFRSLGVFELDEAPGVDGVDYSQVLDLNALHVRFVKFDILSNHNGVVFPATGGPDAAFVGLSEVRFYAGRVPEPGTFALAGLGLAAVLLVGRRRKHAGHA